jgi:hypothetical protein
MRQAGDLSLTALGCGGETDCVVAGISLASGQRVAARTYGSGWRELGLPAASENIQGIACVGSSQCLAVGSVAVDELGNTMTLIAALSGDTWTDEQGPIP